MVIKLSEQTPEAQEKYNKYYKEVLLSGSTGFTYLEPAKEFDENGLRFPLDYLEKVDKSVIFFPLEIMQEYADIVTKTAIDNDDKKFIHEQVHETDLDIPKIFDRFNATGIGNMAYMVMNCKDPEAVKKTRAYLDRIFEIQKGRVLDTVNNNL